MKWKLSVHHTIMKLFWFLEKTNIRRECGVGQRIKTWLGVLVNSSYHCKILEIKHTLSLKHGAELSHYVRFVTGEEDMCQLMKRRPNTAGDMDVVYRAVFDSLMEPNFLLESCRKPETRKNDYRADVLLQHCTVNKENGMLIYNILKTVHGPMMNPHFFSKAVAVFSRVLFRKIEWVYRAFSCFKREEHWSSYFDRKN